MSVRLFPTILPNFADCTTAFSKTIVFLRAAAAPSTNLYNSDRFNRNLFSNFQSHRFKLTAPHILRELLCSFTFQLYLFFRTRQTFCFTKTWAKSFQMVFPNLDSCPLHLPLCHVSYFPDNSNCVPT